jgi:hypothetical protein
MKGTWFRVVSTTGSGSQGNQLLVYFERVVVVTEPVRFVEKLTGFRANALVVKEI